MGIKLQGLNKINQNYTSKKEKIESLKYTLSANRSIFFPYSRDIFGPTSTLSANASHHIDFHYSITDHHRPSVNFSNSFSIDSIYITKTLSSFFLQENLCSGNVGFSNLTTHAVSFVNAFFLGNCKNIFVHIPLKTNL